LLISDTPIDISSETRLATFVFKAELLWTPMLICIEPRIAKVDGADCAVILPQKYIPVVSEPWEVYDKNGNRKIKSEKAEKCEKGENSG
jgi:hypothetical protein